MPADFATHPEARPDRPRWRVGLAHLMALVAVLAVGLAAMKVATGESSRALFGLGLLALLVGTLGALVRRRGRAAWVGFALFGWAYALVALVPALEAVAAELPGDGPLGEVVDLLHPLLSEPSEPAFWSPGTIVQRRVEDAQSGRYRFRYRRSVGVGGSADLTPDEAKQWEAYLGRKAAFEARVEAAHQARRIALIFLGLAFAFVGAAAGHALDDRSTPAGASPGALTPNLPG